MKRLISILLVGLSALFFTACSDNDNPPLAPVEVNMIGTWNYHVSTQNGLCDGLIAEGIQITDSLDGDMNFMGDTHIQGTNLKLDGCEIVPIDEVDARGRGHESVMTQDEYLAYLQFFHNSDSGILSIRIDSYNEIEIVSVFELTDGMLMTARLTRSL